MPLSFNTNTWNKIRYSVYQPFYDIVDLFFKPYREESINGLKLTPKDKVLIIGAGTGLDLYHLNDDYELHAIDITPGMISRLVRRAEHIGITVQAKTMSAHELEYPDAYFDAVILHLIVAVIPDPVKCLAEAARVLKPNGKFTIIDKFVPAGTQPSFIRSILNIITETLFSSIDRDIDQLLDQTSLVKKKDIKLKSIFRLISGSKN